MYKHAIILAATVFVVACGHGDREEDKTTAKVPTDPSSMETKQVAAEEEAAMTTEIEFAKGKAQLGTKNSELLANLIRDASRKGQVDEIKILSWGDQEYPSAEKEELSSVQQRLASNRNNTVEDFIERQTDGVTVNTYNMTERPGFLADLFNTDDARLKKSLEKAGIPNSASTGKRLGKASRSVILVLMK